jgi:hypothetical protein
MFLLNKKDVNMKKNLFLITILFVCLNIQYVSAQEPCVSNAWNAFNSGKYKEAIKYSEQCIEDFGREGLEIQHSLDSMKITPEIGSVNDIQKHRIFQNGLLNDVSTACFIKGRSAEYLYKQDRVKNIAYRQIAVDTYNLVCSRYSKGRCWDPKGWFWSPCKASKVRLPIE